MKLNINGFEVEGDELAIRTLLQNKVVNKELFERQSVSSELDLPNSHDSNKLVDYINNSNGKIMVFTEMAEVFGGNNGTFTAFLGKLVNKNYIKKIGKGKYKSLKFIDNINFYRKRNQNEHKRWNMEDRSYLKKLSDEGKEIKELCKIFGRTPASIYCQLTKANLNKNLFTDDGYLRSSYYKGGMRK